MHRPGSSSSNDYLRGRQPRDGDPAGGGGEGDRVRINCRGSEESVGPQVGDGRDIKRGNGGGGPEWGARNVVQPSFGEERNGRRLPSVFSAYSHLFSHHHHQPLPWRSCRDGTHQR